MASRENMLWASVLKQAFVDAQSPLPKYRRGDYCVKSARSYLLSVSPSLRIVSEGAGVDPHWVVRKAKGVAKRGWCTAFEQELSDLQADVKEFRRKINILRTKDKKPQKIKNGLTVKDYEKKIMLARIGITRLIAKQKKRGEIIE